MSEVTDDLSTIEDSINQTRPKVTIDTTKISKFFIGVAIPQETVTFTETVESKENTNKNFKATEGANKHLLSLRLNASLVDQLDGKTATAFGSPNFIKAGSPYPEFGLSVNGSTQYLLVASTAALNALNGPMSMAIAFNASTKTPANHVALLTKEGAVYEILQLTSGDIRVRFLQGGAGKIATIPAAAWSAGTKYMVMGLYDGANVKAYLGNIATLAITEYVGDAITGNIDTNSNQIAIAHETAGIATGYFHGVVGPAHIFNYAISSTERTNLLTNGVSVVNNPARANFSQASAGP